MWSQWVLRCWCVFDVFGSIVWARFVWVFDKCLWFNWRFLMCFPIEAQFDVPRNSNAYIDYGGIDDESISRNWNIARNSFIFREKLIFQLADWIVKGQIRANFNRCKSYTTSHKWVSEWVRKRVSGRVSECVREWVSTGVSEGVSTCVSECVNTCVSAWVSEWVRAWVQYVREWVREYVREWAGVSDASEWVSWRASEWVSAWEGEGVNERASSWVSECAWVSEWVSELAS